jgi:hypothetical protein
MAIAGRLLRNRRAGDANLAWNLPNLAGPETLTLTSQAFTDGGAIPVEQAGRRAGGQNVSPELSWTQVPDGCPEPIKGRGKSSARSAVRSSPAGGLPVPTNDKRP